MSNMADDDVGLPDDVDDDLDDDLDDDVEDDFDDDVLDPVDDDAGGFARPEPSGETSEPTDPGR